MDLSDLGSVRKATVVPWRMALGAMSSGAAPECRATAALARPAPAAGGDECLPPQCGDELVQAAGRVTWSFQSARRMSAWPAAISLLAALPKRRLAPDLVVSNAGVNALATGGWAPALRLLQSLESVRRDAIRDLDYT